jgi:acetyl esterase/lipase
MGMKQVNLSKVFKIACVCAITLCAFSLGILPSQAAGEPMKSNEEIFLWPGVAPGSENVTIKEVIKDQSKDPNVKSRNIVGITKPSITAFFPEKQNGVVALIVPGGGYTNIVFDKEGTDIAKWLNSFGVTAFVLKSRLPGEGHANYTEVPLQDSQRAMRIIRGHAVAWGLNPAKIGVIGLSAGGHLASMLGTNYDKIVYDRSIDAMDRESARPDFMVLAYAPISTNARIPENDKKAPLTPIQKQELYDEYPTDKQVTADTPKTFLVCAYDDPKVPMENSLRFANSLKKVGVDAELHVFMKGNHGFAIRNAKGPITEWTNLCKAWMNEIGLFK